MYAVGIQKVYVNPGDTAVLACPQCGTTVTQDVGKFKGRRRHLERKCVCKATFRVSLEFRKARRKRTHLEGFYVKLPGTEDWGMMLVRNISRTGIGLLTYGKHDLREGDALRVKFTLDDGSHSEIEKQAVVRWIQDIHMGCEFVESPKYDNAHDAAFRAYVTV
jgi:hypothetical protein